MSLIAMQGGATGTGTVTLLAPITNTNRTLTLPDATGTVLDSTGGTTQTALTVTNGASIQGLTVGRGAGAVSTNTAVGNSAMTTNSTGARNTGLGYFAVQTNSTSNDNTGLGYAALYQTTGATNTGIGSQSLISNTTGASNAALGYNSLNASTTGSFNVAIGTQALQANTTASNNTAVGYQAGYSANRTADANGNNTFIGYTAGYSITTGQNNLLLGYFAGRGGSPSGTLTTESNILCLGDNNIATFYCKQSAINTSDARDKTDIQQFSHGLDWITQLRPVTYRWDMRTNYENGMPNGTHKESRLNLGLIAQEEIEIEKQFGYATDKTNMIVANINEDGSSYGMNYTSLIPLLINSIKELKAIVDAQGAEIAALKGAA
jgi:trimeric autotransporter adhesin